MAAHDGQTDTQAAMKALQEGFGRKLPDRIAEINSIWSSLKEKGVSVALLNKLHLKLHNLNGTSATYHYDTVTKLAREAELIAKAMVEKSSFPTQQQSEIDEVISRLNKTSLTPSSQPDSEIFMPPETANQGSKLVYFVEDDSELLQSTAMHIRMFGYIVETFHDLESFASAFRNSEPDVTIMDIIFNDHEKDGIEMMAELNKGRKRAAKTIFLTSEGDINHRLSAVRAGGVAYFQKTANIGQLIDSLDSLVKQEASEPFRVLLIDDDEEQAKFSELILQQAGMQTRSITQPLQALESLNDFLPDLILMDVYMPECDGLELSKVIRQVDTYVSIPIVFLSSEADLHKQLDAMSLGGDDFLTKPIAPWHLISAVSSRIKRGRIIRTLAECDSLTGLLNHTSGKKRFDAEISRAKRDGSPVSFAMLDIDHFKHVNDVYGHPTGDRVLKSLSGLLRQRLRISDSISRYGGEEFVAILPNTTAVQAKQLMDLIRKDFSAIKQQSEEGGHFQCAFSCGISCFPNPDNSTALINTADKLLYEAKENGRNRIVISPLKQSR